MARWRPHEVRATLQGRIEAERAALLEVGARANLVASAAPSAAEAVVSPPDLLLVVHDGRVIAGTLS